VLADRKDYIFHPFVIIESVPFLGRLRVSSARIVAADVNVKKKKETSQSRTLSTKCGLKLIKGPAFALLNLLHVRFNFPNSGNGMLRDERGDWESVRSCNRDRIIMEIRDRRHRDDTAEPLSVLFDSASCRKELPPEVRFSGSIPYAIGRRGCVRVPTTDEGRRGNGRCLRIARSRSRRSADSPVQERELGTRDINRTITVRSAHARREIQTRAGFWRPEMGERDAEQLSIFHARFFALVRVSDLLSPLKPRDVISEMSQMRR